mgnify:CR=1 FL=1
MVDKVGLTVGQIVGSIDNMIKSIPTEGVRQSYTEAVGSVKEKYISPETRGKWAGIKGTVKSWNSSINETLKPTTNKIAEVKSSVG